MRYSLRQSCLFFHVRQPMLSKIRPASPVPGDPALGAFAAARRVYSKRMRIDLFTVRNPAQNHRDFFHLNCVPRHWLCGIPRLFFKFSCSRAGQYGINKGGETSVALLESAEDLESFGGPGRALQRLDILRVGFLVLISTVSLGSPGRR